MIKTSPISGQTPGTSGLRKKTAEFMKPHFLQNYVQSIFDGIGGVKGKTFILGGDGRYFNNDAIQIILKMAAANGMARMIVGQDGLLSTPAASHLIRLHETDGGLILSASHNLGGPNADFGLKYNMPNGGPATEFVTDGIVAATQKIDRYFIVEADDIPLSSIAKFELAGMTIDVVSPTDDYIQLMSKLFDFEAIRAMFGDGFRMTFDAMHAITGPYAVALFEGALGAPQGTVINATPSPDFGGGHPDPNPVWAKELMAIMYGPDAPDFGAASDGDGDRNMIVGPNQYISSSDSLAFLAAQAEAAPAFAAGLTGVARSMPTSGAVDRVADAKGIDCFETPTGWKFFGNLLDAGRVQLCGEESAGTGGNHAREKDGLWAVLLWLNILAKKKGSVSNLMKNHWATYGRNYYTRHDYEAVPKDIADGIISDLRARLTAIGGQTAGALTIQRADEFSYNDPVDKSVSTGQGLRIFFDGGARAVLRLSGTGTEGATIRVYLERLVTDTNELTLDPQVALEDLIAATEALTGIRSKTGRDGPDVIT
ncbi:alpha-D-glucose phosphate-specific phosphoglucomutase [Cognatiyoonia sp.]|uniref:alpha-D-glucose phosphate-specific phosphoglucomutase n=1 Tax=Cognatiyoonia sp. TaxID=2211652 RepID=UPI003F6A05BB